ncbi:unnamed protein product, partial [Allacma fusca]
TCPAWINGRSSPGQRLTVLFPPFEVNALLYILKEILPCNSIEAVHKILKMKRHVIIAESRKAMSIEFNIEEEYMCCRNKSDYMRTLLRDIYGSDGHVPFNRKFQWRKEIIRADLTTQDNKWSGERVVYKYR